MWGCVSHWGMDVRLWWLACSQELASPGYWSGSWVWSLFFLPVQVPRTGSGGHVAHSRRLDQKNNIQGCVCFEPRLHTCCRLASEVNWSIRVCTCFDTCSHTDLFNSSWTRVSCVGIQITIISLSKISYFYIKLWGGAASCVNQRWASGDGSRVGTTCLCPPSLPFPSDDVPEGAIRVPSVWCRKTKRCWKWMCETKRLITRKPSEPQGCSDLLSGDSRQSGRQGPLLWSKVYEEACEVELLDLNFYGVCLFVALIILSLQPVLGTQWFLLHLSLQVAEKLPENRGLVWNLSKPCIFQKDACCLLSLGTASL